MKGSIRQRLTIAFIGLVVLPLLLVGLGQAVQSVQNQREQAIYVQNQIGERVAVQVESFIASLERDLQAVVFVNGLQDLSRAQQRDVFQELMLFQDAFEELTLVNEFGTETLRISQLDLVTDNELTSRLNDEAFTSPAASSETYYSPVWFNPGSGEPFITISVPLMNVRDGQFQGVLIANTRLKKVWDLLGSMMLGEGESVYIVDAQNRVVAHPNPSLVLRQTEFVVPQNEGLNPGLDSPSVFLAVEELRFGEQSFYIIAERSLDVALAPARNVMKVTAVTVFVVFIIASFLGFVVLRQLIRPLQELAETAHEIRGGDLSVRVSIPKHQDEVRELALAFNSMADQLQQTMASQDEHILDLQAAEKRLRLYAANLERSNNELQSFAYVASHDLQEPLRKIRTFSDRLLNQYTAVLDDRGVDYLVRMESAAARMQGLIQDLLTFSRVTTQERPFTEVNLLNTVQDVLDDLELRIEETKADISVGQLPVIEADPNQMHQLFQNLVENSLKFSAKNMPPQVLIQSEQMQNGYSSYWQISVSDNGIGFDEKYVDRIFTIFQRLHGRQGYEGTGVGLAICRKIIERHDGNITAKSQPGLGTTFTLILPEKHEVVS